MPKRNWLRVLAVWCLLSVSTIAWAQGLSTVSDILDRGGNRVGREDLMALISGATISGSQVGRPQTTFENVHRADGTLSGRAIDRGMQVTYDGTWSADADGRLCYDFRNNRGATFKSCTVWFVVDRAYYASDTDDRRARVYQRDVKR